MTDPDNQGIGGLLPVYLPRLGESITEATVTRWLIKPGDYVDSGQPLVEIDTVKTDVELPAPASGYLRNIAVAEDETVLVGSKLAEIEVADPPKEHSEAETEQVHLVAKPYYLAAPPWLATTTDPTVSRWLKGEGESLSSGENILDFCTQFGDIGFPCPVNGVLRSILVSDDDIVVPGTALALVEIMVPDSIE
jgi:2-oxoglutarate dehydrogenase E2 component (dihydrolipoamide succinyltransferase)